MNGEGDSNSLRSLAELYGIEPAHVDGLGQRVAASPETLLALLRALGAPLERADEVGSVLDARRRERAERRSEPVAVVWEGDPLFLPWHGPGPGAVAWRMVLDSSLEPGQESGEEWQGELYAAGEGPFPLPLPQPLPLGYHRLLVATQDGGGETLVVAAPRRAWHQAGDRRWGAFLPLYALTSQESLGVGDLGDLGRLVRWVAERGGGAVGSLPLLPAYLDRPCDPSPYAPLSRRFWNELYLDPRPLPGFAHSPAAQALAGSADFQAEAAALRAGRRVDYRRALALKRPLFALLAQECRERGGAEADEVHRYLERKPLAGRYAAFRAVQERLGTTWQEWPERLRRGELEPADWHEEPRWLHLWMQAALERQMGELAGEARRRGAPLYLDFPLGVHAGGFDVWAERELFALGASAGAPPDALFTGGQDWGLPPLHPERLRVSGHAYWIDCLRHHLAPAGLLRIDHVMQLHRLYWVPAGATARDGAYVRYPAEELLAILCLESHRAATVLVGENLGTVPPESEAARARHGLLGLNVRQFDLHASHPSSSPPADTVAALNTHDMPTFRGYCEGRDLDDLEALGLYAPTRAAAARAGRRELLRALTEVPLAGSPPPVPELDGASPILTICARQLEDLAASPARWLMVNLEDLWGEGEPQNVPGTNLERPNWHRRAALTLEEITADRAVAGILRHIDALRRSPLSAAPAGEDPASAGAGDREE